MKIGIIELEDGQKEIHLWDDNENEKILCSHNKEEIKQFIKDNIHCKDMAEKIIRELDYIYKNYRR